MAGELKHQSVGQELTQAEFEGIGLHQIDGVNAGLVIANKVDKVTGKSLSANDYTDLEKAKLATLSQQIFVQDDAPDFVGGIGLWVETGLGTGGSDMTIWIEDGL
jgi:hypothetical protein